jgi:hypothetical protein
MTDDTPSLAQSPDREALTDLLETAKILLNLCEENYVKHQTSYFREYGLTPSLQASQSIISRAEAALAPGNAGAVEARTVAYDYDAKGNIVLPEGAPFDGNPVLVRFAAGWCEARWESYDKDADDGFCWVCLDDSAPQQELDDAKEWMPLPGSAAPLPATQGDMPADLSDGLPHLNRNE